MSFLDFLGDGLGGTLGGAVTQAAPDLGTILSGVDVGLPSDLMNGATPLNPVDILPTPSFTPAPSFSDPGALTQFPNLTGLLSGGGGTTPSVKLPSGGAAPPTPGVSVPGASVPSGGVPANITNLLTGGGGAGLGALAAILPSLAGMVSQPGLPPQAKTLTGIADNNQQLIDNQLMPTALANQQGNINGQALSTIDRQLQASEAATRQAYAGMDASGSSMEAQDLAGLRAKAADQVFATGQEMASTGLSTASTLMGYDNSIYNEVMQAQIQQDQQFSDTISAFAKALGTAMSGSQTQINTGQGGTTSTPITTPLLGATPLTPVDPLGLGPTAPQLVPPVADPGPLTTLPSDLNLEA